MSHDLIDDLRAEIAKGHVLVVVGAGVSIGATRGNPLASWQGLLENGVERCVADKHAALASGDLARELAYWIEERFELPPVRLPNLHRYPPNRAAQVIRTECPKAISSARFQGLQA